MTIKKLGINKEATVLLGAGASRGAGPFQDAMVPAPLDTDFFQLMEMIRHRDSKLGNFLTTVRDEIGTSSYPRMEEWFSRIESLAQFHAELKTTKGRKLKKYDSILDSFVSTIALFFSMIFNVEEDGVQRHVDCEYHKRLATSLKSSDVILNFNYDCLMDNALRLYSGTRWNPSKSYGFDITVEPDSLWTPSVVKGRKSQTPIKHLKLHGSLNWDRTDMVDRTRVGLRNDPYSRINRARSEVIPPVWKKVITDDNILIEVWKEARASLRRGPVFIAIGYSVPQTDMLSQSLLRFESETRPTKYSDIIVVNPDSTARFRLLDLMRGGFNSDTRILEFSSISSFSKILDD